MEKNFDGKFLVIDGPDGCGKSTQTAALIEYVQNSGAKVVTARDPGGTVIGEKIRHILLDTEHDQMGDNVEVMLYMASRAQLYKQVIGPALSAGDCVILDRWLSSTCAYQGHAGRFGMQKVLKIAADTLEKVWPDATVILDADLETAKKRMNRQLDRMELKGDAYHTLVREGFLKFSELNDSVAVVNACRDIDRVRRDMISALEKILFS